MDDPTEAMQCVRRIHKGNKLSFEMKYIYDKLITFSLSNQY